MYIWIKICHGVREIERTFIINTSFCQDTLCWYLDNDIPQSATIGRQFFSLCKRNLENRGNLHKNNYRLVCGISRTQEALKLSNTKRIVHLSLPHALEQRHSVVVKRQSFYFRHERTWLQISARRPDSLSELFNGFRHFLQEEVWTLSQRWNCHCSLSFFSNSKFTYQPTNPATIFLKQA
jgi:hypothetical protein